MAKHKGAKRETKSDFLRKVLARKPELEHHQVNHLWMKAGHAGEISSALFYQVRAKMGIKFEWRWVKESEPEAAATSVPSRGAKARPARPQPETATGEVYQFKITLLESQPVIWRRFQVLDCTLDKLHEHIQTAMGWTNSHLHHFTIEGRLYGDPMLMAETFEELNYADSTTTRLSDILPESGAAVPVRVRVRLRGLLAARGPLRGSPGGRAGQGLSALPGGRTRLPARGRGRDLGVPGLPRSTRRPRE